MHVRNYMVAGRSDEKEPPLDFADEALVNRYAAALPRYTSYPTANHFNASVGPSDYRDWLGGLDEDIALSLYLHIPFCESLCWYCACSTKATRRYEPIAAYLDAVEMEMLTVSQLLPRRLRMTHLHWGGGSPDILSSDDIRRLGNALKNRFGISSETEFAVEIDPRLMTPEKAASLVEIGVNRLSLGVQDFEPVVLKAIGREQSYETTRQALDFFCNLGIRSVNVDLVYGLPYQTEASLERTVEKVIALSPHRIAVFGYAHLPQRMHNQRMIDEAALPGPMQRFSMARRLTWLLEQAGYQQLGLDHFARPDDSLATRRLSRNFQGYTTDRADALIGLGASAIGRFPQGYVQNVVSTADYIRRVEQGNLGTVRGWALSQDDKLRAFVIERLMCDFAFSSQAVHDRFGSVAAELRHEAECVVASAADGLIERTDDGFRLTQLGRPFVRSFCSSFDAYLNRTAVDKSRHSLSV